MKTRLRKHNFHGVCQPASVLLGPVYTERQSQPCDGFTDIGLNENNGNKQ